MEVQVRKIEFAVDVKRRCHLGWVVEGCCSLGSIMLYDKFTWVANYNPKEEGRDNADRTEKERFKVDLEVVRIDGMELNEDSLSTGLFARMIVAGKGGDLIKPFALLIGEMA